MPDDLNTPALRRFGRDLHRIREDRDVDLATLHEATQVPQSDLQSFEAGTLFDQSRMTSIYLRAFVRTYAEAVGIPTDPVMDQLESALAGDYQNQLAVQYLDVPPSMAEEQSSPGAEEGSTPDGQIHSESSPSDEEAEASSGENVDTHSSEPESEESTERAVGEEKGDARSRSVSGSVASSEAAVGASGSAGKQSSERSPGQSLAASVVDVGRTLWTEHRGPLLGTIVGLILLVVFVGLVTTYGGGSGSPTESPRSETTSRQSASDTFSADTTKAASSSEQRPLADITLGDTLHVTVVATSDVRELRVQQDDYLRRPYWIVAGEAMVFPFVRRITLQNQLDSLRLLLEGYSYSTSQTDDQGRIVITRDTAEQFADTLRASPVPVPTSPDTVLGNAPTSETARPLSVPFSAVRARR